MQLHNKLSPCFFSHSYRFICFFAILANNSSTYNLFVPKRIFEQGFRLLKKCIYASAEKHKALCEKYKAFISKYKAHILKYVPYIFRFFKCVINRGLYQCIFIHFLTVDKTLKNTVTRIRFALTPLFHNSEWLLSEFISQCQQKLTSVEFQLCARSFICL